MVAARPCPVCRRPAVGNFRPFCSRKCADVDLGRWLKESYVIPGAPAPESEGEGDREKDADSGD